MGVPHATETRSVESTVARLSAGRPWSKLPPTRRRGFRPGAAGPSSGRVPLFAVTQGPLPPRPFGPNLGVQLVMELDLDGSPVVAWIDAGLRSKLQDSPGPRLGRSTLHLTNAVTFVTLAIRTRPRCLRSPDPEPHCRTPATWSRSYACTTPCGARTDTRSPRSCTGHPVGPREIGHPD